MLRFTDNLIIQMTLDCNYNCKFCMQGDQSTRENLYHHKKMSFEDIKNIIDTAIYERCILGSFDNAIEFHLHGGELFLLDFPIIKRTVSYIEERKKFFPNISFCVQSNGSLLTKDICKFFSRNNWSMGISFDGFHEKEMHGWNKDAENRIKKLQKLQEETGIFFGFLNLISKDNVKTIYEDNELLSSMFKFPSSFCMIGSNILCGFDETSYKEVPSYEDVWNFYYKRMLSDMKLKKNKFEDLNISLMIESALNSIIFNNIPVYKTGCFNRLCGFYSNMISVDPKNELSPCDKWMAKGDYYNLRPHQPIGSSDFLGLQHLNNVIKYYVDFQKLEKKYKCDTCFAKNICIGQCQAHQISTKGYLDQDKNACDLYKKIYRYIYKNWPQLGSNRYWSILGNPSEVNPSALLVLDEYKKKIIIQDKKFRLGDM